MESKARSDWARQYNDVKNSGRSLDRRQGDDGMMMHGGGGGGWFMSMRATDEKPRVTWTLLRRVLGYAMPYRWQILAMLLMILSTTALGLLSPLVTRDLIDRTLPQR